jgi:hypothetical protein
MVAMMIVMMEVVEMNGFFLKYVLWYLYPLLSLSLSLSRWCCALVSD